MTTSSLNTPQEDLIHSRTAQLENKINTTTTTSTSLTRTLSSPPHKVSSIQFSSS